MILGKSLARSLGKSVAKSLAGGDTITYVVTFSCTHGSVGATVDGIGIQSGQEVEKGKTVVFTITADEGYEYTGTNPESVIVTSAITKSYECTLRVFPVIFSCTNGSVGATVDDIGIQSGESVAYGKTVIFTITPDEGYEYTGTNPESVVVTSAITKNYECTEAANYLTFTCTYSTGTGSTIYWSTPSSYPSTVYYSLNGGDWTELPTSTSTAPTIVNGDVIRFKGTNNYISYNKNNTSKFNVGSVTNTKMQVTGSVMSLLDGTGQLTTIYQNYCFRMLLRNLSNITKVGNICTATTLSAGCYSQLVYGCSKLSDISEFQLPVLTLGIEAYAEMFQGCTAITTAPALPATSVGSTCYSSMFNGCTHLTTAPALPATSIGTYCYQNMFYGCTALTTPPVLPAPTVKTQSYYQMFYGCTSLVTAPALPATTIAYQCYGSMFYGCTRLTTAPSTLPATALVQYCYESMFSGCSALTDAPSLPATTLVNYCYYTMFKGCTSLVIAPSLPATTLASYCYLGMFQNCTSIVTAPSLPATTLASQCYKWMFNGCTSLNEVHCSATDISANDCTSLWLNGVASTGDFYTPSSTAWTTGVSGIPSGWTRHDE